MITIRIAVTADIPAMQRIRAAVRENRLSDPSSIRDEDVRSMLEEHGRGWVAEVEGSVVGFSIADLTRSNVWALFVEPGSERAGIGRRLHDVMLDWLFSNGAERIWLTTEPGTRAIEFYQAAGWLPVAGADNQDDQEEVRYEMQRRHWMNCQ